MILDRIPILTSLPMGYNLTRYPVIRNKPQLEVLLKAREDVYFNTDYPERLAYNIREAIRAAKEHEEFQHYYFEIAGFYKFETLNDVLIARRIVQDEVETRINGKKPKILTQSSAEEDTKGAKDSSELGKNQHTSSKTDPPAERLTFEDVSSLVEVLILVQKNAGTKEIYFPGTKLNLPEKVRLHNFTQGTEWKYLDHDINGITLTKNPVPEDMIWSPVS